MQNSKKITLTPSGYVSPRLEGTMQSFLFSLAQTVPSAGYLFPFLFSYSLFKMQLKCHFCGAFPVSYPIPSIHNGMLPFWATPVFCTFLHYGIHHRVLYLLLWVFACLSTFSHRP